MSSSITYGQKLSREDEALRLWMETAQLFGAWNFTQIEKDENVINEEILKVGYDLKQKWYILIFFMLALKGPLPDSDISLPFAVGKA